MIKDECVVLCENRGDFKINGDTFYLEMLAQDYYKSNIVMLIDKSGKTFIVKNKYGDYGRVDFLQYKVIRKI